MLLCPEPITIVVFTAAVNEKVHIKTDTEKD